MIEFDVDMRYLLEADELDCVILNDESGEREPMKLTPELGNGTLTAEQVRDTVEKHWHDLSAEYDMPEATALPEYSYDWQAIADELNARVERTCEYVIEDNMNESEGMGDVWFRCTNCDMCFDYADDWLFKMPYCPHCGARVKARNE